MIPFSLQQLADITEGQLKGNDVTISAVTTDTRQVDAGALFIALVGERFDGHHFAEQAIAQGAQALLVSQALPVGVPQVVVADTKQALGKISAWVHQQAQAKTFALTGSCGKTTVKEMLASILQLKGQVLATAGNFNNDIGVPLTLLRSQANDDYAVIELGANHQGEIAYTTQLVQPQIALVNNVAAAHLEGFGSLEGVAKAKGEIFQGLPTGGVAVINLDSNGLAQWQSVLADKKVVTISTQQANADYFAADMTVNSQGQAQFILLSPLGEARVHLPMIGLHNVSNALAAAAMAAAGGASLDEIVTGLERATNVKGRVEAITLSENIRLIDDSYNASVPAMKAAVDLLANYSGVRWLVLGFMAELGQESLALHRQVGEYAAQFSFDYVLTYGEDSKVISDVCAGVHFATHDEMITFITQQLEQQTDQTHTLLVKGANSSKMSQIVAALKENYA